MLRAAGPPFRSVAAALAWAYRVERSRDHLRSNLDFTPGSDVALTRLERLAQAGVIVRHAEDVLDPARSGTLQMAFARFYYGRAATAEDLRGLRIYVARGLPEWAGRGVNGDGVEKLLMRFAGATVGLHGVKRAFRCRFDRAKQLAAITHDRLQPLKDEIERRLEPRLRGAGLLTDG